ncbi:uncharacterized protein SPSK_06843 [Sporothrix schenckii 1099-18]|uniref:USP domain-containing protein n=1 Tax=Sporothrix schenckii 1099-18 TaxID=1397361 RepID=A0A0F2MKJ1_SPOSC|nr:uncharacterized protein SPSK_06843 [Sporothrix schenckii 1099-18]KJR88706.1 hypothetical protein SPSK_06843 [Sporothrix schenckii 1099-18]
MERESRSPEIESNEGAGSPEASSARPNPFKGGDESSRKRRRTSLNVDSRSRSVESDAQSPHETPIVDTIHLSSSPPAVEAEPDDSIMIMDSGPAPSSPRTPERTPIQNPGDILPPPGFESEARQTTGPSPRVTLSLRNSAPRTLDTIPSSPPASPTPSGRPSAEHTNDNSMAPPNGRKAADGATPAADAMNATLPLANETTQPSDTDRSRTTSPQIEIVDIVSDDGDAGFGPSAPNVTLLSETTGVPLDAIPDPSDDFPYLTNGDAPADIMMVLMGPLTQDPSISHQLQTWIDQYLLFAKTSPFERVYESYTVHRSLWLALPDLIWGTPNLRAPGFGTADLETRLKVFTFCVSFARLAAFFVEFEVNLLQRLSSSGNLQSREHISTFYLLALISLTKRDISLKDEDRMEVAFESDDTSAILEQFSSFHQTERGGTLRLLYRLLELQVLIMPTDPKIIENFSQVCVIAACVTREAYRNVARADHAPFALAAEKDVLALGRTVFNTASAALDTAITNHITAVSQDNASHCIASLGDLVYINLKVDEQEAVRLATSIEERYPMPLECIPDAFAMKWRFTMFCRLIKNSQMQLRLMAVTNLCQELVGCWRRYGDQAQEHLQDEYVLRYVTDVLANTGVVAYMLGPTCHPEITAESGNIIGFLAVTRTYTNAHTDLFWQTVTNTQNPRISEALIRTACRIGNLFSFEAAVYFCRGFLEVPIASFTPSMRELCEVFLRHVCSKAPQESEASMDSIIPFDVCLQLLRESSIPSATGPVAYPEVQGFAIGKLRECLASVPIDLDQRQSLYQTCLLDLTQKSRTTLGSLSAITIINGHYGNRDLAFLTAEHDLTKLIVDELEDAIAKGRTLAIPAVISGPANAPRRDIIYSVVLNHPYTLTSELSARLWDMMAGSAAACKEDRNASWNIFIMCLRRGRPQENNPFLTQCLTEFLPGLAPDCFCESLLEFLRERLVPLLNDIACSLFDVASTKGQQSKAIVDEDKSIDRITLEQLWRIVLTAPPNTIERRATHFLVKDVYIDSQCIRAFPLYRSRKIHLALVSRCLEQLSSAAKNLKYATTEKAMTKSEDDNHLAGPTESASFIYEQELLFIRSLKVLQEFLHLYRASSQFSTPDLRPFITDNLNSVAGESAELKYQSFDGDSQTEVKPLNIGRQNTAASLLASLKEVTGFDNYRMYYRGQAFAPKGGDICRSLEELRIHNGLILVKRDVDPEDDTEETYAGGSPVESEILKHFHELWGYLSMEEQLASEIQEFLVELTIDEEFLHRFDKDGVSYKDVFYIGQPYKSLYTLHALREYLVLRHRTESEAVTVVSSSCESEDTETQMRTPDSADAQLQGPESAADTSAPKNNEPQVTTLPEVSSPTTPALPYQSALAQVTNLVTSALCDPSVTEISANACLQVELKAKLLQMLNFALSSSQLNESASKSLDAKLLSRLMEILSAEFQSRLENSTRVVRLAFKVIMNACALSREFWEAFRTHDNTPFLTEQLLLLDDRLDIRQLAVVQIGNRIRSQNALVTVGASDFQEFFWPVILAIVPKAVLEPTKCEGVFNLADQLFGDLLEANSSTLDIPALLSSMGDLILTCTTSEDVTQPECADYAMFGLSRLFNSIYRASQNLDIVGAVPSSFMNKLFWKHLFPPWRSSASNIEGSSASSKLSYPRIVVSSQTRALLMKIISDLIDDNANLLPSIIRNLDQLVPCEKSEDEEPYHYELPSLFDRSRALRAPCGYVGLRNLSNTCYFNSLFTQLFMNVPFRQFMMNVEVRDEGDTQNLLFQTRILFGFLQDSIRRFVDTQMCVGSVKTYDDTTIDIHNQMDVDEFYNLLFDRWEGQLLSEEDKKAFRSFFGGQIVQQVRSKECEHVSERLEPFSAIQCDIKGKTSLQESLRAYVEGEIMEGDNKYNCSSCDRHVDAIKRACLKDIPDHLIFHLKRFDFNLRTLQRSKINDRFSFPHEIDMRPYTIDHLSNPDEEQLADVFELVGVLVHSGTAESGHYYSYIRERPTSNENESWVEFNDDIVSTWDHSLMESMCFGGTVDRTGSLYSVDANNGIPSEKVYSAYMLFYQRSSSLKREQDALALSGRSSPSKAEIPAALSDHIHNENTSLVRRHALYDPQHLPFVSKMLNHVQFARPGGECSANHRLENLAIQMALSHLDQVASRTKDTPDFQTLFNGVSAMGKKCALCSLAIFDYFDSRPEILKQMVQRSLDPEVRLEMGRLIIGSLKSIKSAFPISYTSFEDEPEMDTDDDEQSGVGVLGKRTELHRSSSIIHSAAYMMQILWETFHLVSRSWNEVFGFMLAFASMGREEVGIFLDLEGFRRTILTISADTAFPLDQQFSRMVIMLQRRNRPPSFENVIALFGTLLVGMYPSRPQPRTESEMYVNDNTNRFSLAISDAEGDIPMSRTEYLLMGRDWNRDFGNVFVDKLIAIDQNPQATNAIIAHLMATHPAMEAKVYTTLKANVSSNAAAAPQSPFLRATIVFLQNAKSEPLASGMMKHLSEQCRGVAHGEGRMFFETLRGLYHGRTAATGQVDVKAIIDGLRYIPIWVPGLLCYFDMSVTSHVEAFLQENIFSYGPNPQFEEDEGGQERATELVLAVKRLGVEMFQYIQVAFIQRDAPISGTVVGAVQRLMTECVPYYSQADGEPEDELSAQFLNLSTSAYSVTLYDPD